jgi:two-component system LytT family sensor kinase
LLQAGLLIGCWTIPALIFVPQTYQANLNTSEPVTVWEALKANLALFYTWAALTPVIFWLGRRFPIERKKIFRNLLILFFLGVPVVLIQVVALDYLNGLVFGELKGFRLPTSLRHMLITLGAFDFTIYWTISAFIHALSYFRKYQERELRLTQAQLQALKMQLHPHFLFNTLNAISELIYEEPETAERTITQLSDLLRLSLKSGKEQEVVLREELDFLQKYIEIHQTLMHERLTVRLDIEPETYDALVPNLILQPLVENSIRHGIAPRAEGGMIEIKAHHIDGTLNLEVCDDGIGLSPDAESAARDGVGITNTRARLQYLYGDAYRLELRESSKGGLAVNVHIPFRERAENYHADTYIDC